MKTRQTGEEGTQAREGIQVKGLSLPGVDTEKGVQIYQTAIECAVHEEQDLRQYLEQTERHEEILRDFCQKPGLDPDEETPGRKIVRHLGESSLSPAERLFRQPGAV